MSPNHFFFYSSIVSKQT